MAADAGKELVRRLLEEALVGARPEEADVLAGPAFVGHAPADRTFRGSDGLKAYAARLRRGFPDLEATVEVIFGEGATVVAEFTLRGTHRGWYRGVPPTKRPIELPGSAMAHVRDGAVDELGRSGTRCSCSSSST